MNQSQLINSYEYKSYYIWEFTHGFQTDAGNGIFNTLQEAKEFIDHES